MTANFSYLPILRWKQGEQGALRNVAVADRASMLPITEIQLLEPGSAQPILQRQLIRSAGTEHPIGLDLATAYTGPVPLLALADLSRRLRHAGVYAWPVIRVPHAILDVAGLVHFKGHPAVILRANGHSTPVSDFSAMATATRKACGKNTLIYAVIDLYALGDVDVHAKAAILRHHVLTLSALGELASIGMAGGSFPMNLGALKPGVGNKLPRRELDVWKILRSHAGCSHVIFGDYGVTNPEPLEDIDPTKMNPAAAIRYTLKNEWWVLRGSGVRTKGKGGMSQYNGLCQLLIKSPNYSGQHFSFGDGQYYAHAQPGASSGNLTTWRRDATSHHIVFTTRQILTGSV